MKRSLLLAAALFAAAVPQRAFAAKAAVATADVNMRAGPGTNYPVVRVVPLGSAVTTFGCLADYSWCDVGFAGARGWIAAGYLTTYVANVPVVVGPRVSVPVVTFGPAYWQTYYVGYSWYARGPAYYHHPPAARSCLNGCSASRSVTGPRGRTASRSVTINP